MTERIDSPTMRTAIHIVVLAAPDDKHLSLHVTSNSGLIFPEAGSHFQLAALLHAVPSQGTCGSKTLDFELNN